MKATRLYTLLALLLMAGSGTSFGQSAEQFFIGTEPGELIIQGTWYEYNVMTYRYNLYRFTNHGADVEVLATYDDYNWVIDPQTMSGMGELLYDATPGHFYNMDFVTSNKILATDDTGQTWRVIEDYNIPSPPSYWCFANEHGELVKFEPDDQYNPQNYSFIASYDYGAHFSDTIATFPIPVYTNHVAGWNHGEFYCREYGSDRWYYTTDFFETADTLTFPAELHSMPIGIGPREGELYCRYKPAGVFSKLQRVDYSDDYGANFRTLVDLESNPIDVIVDTMMFTHYALGGGNLFLDREPGVFYVIFDSLTFNFPDDPPYPEEPQGDRYWIAYYRDYGNTLVTTYYHDFKPDWFEHHTPVMDCEITNCGENSVTLRWNEPELKPDEVLVGYQVYGGVALISEDLITETEYTDNFSGRGRLNYHVLAVYSDGETSKSYNIVYCKQTEGVGENENGTKVAVFPNPANGLVCIEGVVADEVQVYNALGQLVKTVRGTNEIDVADLVEGVYLVRIMDAEGKVYTNKITIR